MTVQRELEAQLRRNAEDDFAATVMIPIEDPSPDAPEHLHNPLQSYPGTWRRESTPEARPAHYIHVENDSAAAQPPSR